MRYSRFIRTFIHTCRLATLSLLVMWCLLPAPGYGADTDPYAELVGRSHRINDMICKAIVEMDLAAASIPEHPNHIVSLRRNARVTIGGELRTASAYSRGQWKDPGLNPAPARRGKSSSKMVDLSLSTAKLLLGVDVGDRWRAFIDLDLDGYHGRHRQTRVVNVTPAGQLAPVYERYHENDIIGQAYVELLKDGHSGFGFMAGRLKLPYGLWNRPNLFAQSFMDAPDLTGSYLMNPEAWDSAVRLPHASRLTDPVLGAIVSYEMRDIIRFEAALFRETDENLRPSRRDASRYARESTAPRSWQVGFSILPLEDWELTAHFRNRYSRSRGARYWSDSPYRWDFASNLVSGRHDPRWDTALGQWSDEGDGESFNSRSSEQSLILGLAVEVPNTSLKVRAEYAHGWNQGFNKYLNSDGVSLGMSYRLTPFLSLHVQADWLHVKDRSWMGSDGGSGWMRDTRNNRLYRSYAGLEYELTRGVTLEAGWQYEYWRITSSIGGVGGVSDRRLNTSNTLYLGSRFVF